MPAGSKRIPIVHLPKTIDNDYTGIDFTFGYFTAVDTLASEIRNLLYDAEATRVYYLAETMGRSAGWLAYGAAIAGEASLVISVEDIHGPYAADRGNSTTKRPAKKTTRKIMNVDAVVKRIVKMMRVREEKEGKQYGVIVVAEGLAEYLPTEYLKDIPRDEHKHISVAQVNLNRRLARYVSDEYKQANRPGSPRHRPATGLRSPLRQAARFRRDARQPTGRRRLSGTGGTTLRRRDGFGPRPTGAGLRAVREAGRPDNAGDHGPLHRSCNPISTNWRGFWKRM